MSTFDASVTITIWAMILLYDPYQFNLYVFDLMDQPLTDTIDPYLEALLLSYETRLRTLSIRFSSKLRNVISDVLSCYLSKWRLIQSQRRLFQFHGCTSPLSDPIEIHQYLAEFGCITQNSGSFLSCKLGLWLQSSHPFPGPLFRSIWYINAARNRLYFP